MIDYGSTDNSNSIIKEICPTWKIVPTVNEYFDCFPCDHEVSNHEVTVSGYKIALNTTEFLIGHIKNMLVDEPTSYHIKSYIMCDPKNLCPIEPHYNSPLYEQCYHGVHDMGYRQSRIMHNEKNYHYAAGRHSPSITTDQACILWYGLSPWNQKTIDRKLQIQHKISEASIRAGFGSHHCTDHERLNNLHSYWSSNTGDIRDIIHPFV